LQLLISTGILLIVVLETLNKDEIDGIFDKNSKKVLNFLLQKTLISYPEFLPTQKQDSLYLEKKQCEQWIVQSLGLMPVGEGSYPIDGIREKNGYDVSTLSLGQTPKTKKMKSQTGEKSLGQKFEDENFGELDDTLDELFQKKEGDKIVNAWKDILEKKWNKTIKEKKLEALYLVNLILYKIKSKLYVFLLKINHEKLKGIKKGEFSKKGSSVDVKNIIDPKFGNVKIYKAKKRLELRLKPKEFLERGYYLEFSLENNIASKNLRDIFDNDDDLEKYCDQEIERYKSFFEKLKK
tara:strand:+ start:1237 stop:2118 length:882 start_codon:yes stop_codon:yes gene_type:complete